MQVQHNGTWGAICGSPASGWDINDAHVICRMLGYKAAVNYIYWIEGKTSTKMLMTDVKCSGKEKSIAECPHRGWWNVPSWTGCSYKTLAGVVCQVDKGKN